MHDTEDKKWWVEYGKELEHQFVQLCVEVLGLDACINPAKETDKLAPDLVVEGRIADLKTHRTPFFMAEKFAGVPAEFAVTFNNIDYDRYCRLYPEIDVYYWVDWPASEMQVRGKTYVSPSQKGIYVLPFAEIKSIIESGAYEHVYARRINDRRGNAKSSFVLDLRDFTKLQ